jgi:phosphoribosyl 1,2-cyclic phosphodiesterase
MRSDRIVAGYPVPLAIVQLTQRSHPVLVFRSLASGSSGNAFLLRSGPTSLLLDAGLPTKRLIQALSAESMDPARLSAILISHEHRDHCSAVADLTAGHSVPVWANVETLRACGLYDSPRAAVLPIGVPTRFGEVEVLTFPVHHDAAAPVGFSIRVQDRVIVIATDLGSTNEAVAQAVAHAPQRPVSSALTATRVRADRSSVE